MKLKRFRLQFGGLQARAGTMIMHTGLRNLSIAVLALAMIGVISCDCYATPIPLGGGAGLQINNMVGTLVGVSNGCINWNSGLTCALPPTAVQDTVSGQDQAVFTVGSTPQDTIKTYLPVSQHR
jgi:hypothetical protein